MSEPWDPRPKELIGVGEPPAARPRARPPQCSRRHWFEMQDPNPVGREVQWRREADTEAERGRRVG